MHGIDATKNAIYSAIDAAVHVGVPASALRLPVHKCTLDSAMKEPGLDGRHRNKDGTIQQKRSDTQNQNLPRPVPGFKPTTTLKTIRQKTGEVSERDILNKTKPKR